MTEDQKQKLALDLLTANYLKQRINLLISLRKAQPNTKPNKKAPK